MSRRSFKTNHHQYVTQPEIEYDSEEFKYYPDMDSDEELDDDIVESLIFLEVTTITELVDIFYKDVTRNGISQTHLTHLLLALYFHKYNTRAVESLWTIEAVPMQYSLRYSKMMD